MNHSVRHVITQLTWEKNELMQRLHQNEHEYIALTKQIRQLDEQTQHATTNSLTIINPELEMSRLHFIIQIQKQKMNAQQKAQEQLHHTKSLQQQIQRIKMELLMLERYLAQHQQKINLERQKTAEHQLEEWVLQRRGRQ